jgi:hypothetical protein
MIHPVIIGISGNNPVTMGWRIGVAALVVYSTITMVGTNIIHLVNQEHFVIFEVLHDLSGTK